jgi:hypothetical protein
MLIINCKVIKYQISPPGAQIYYIRKHLVLSRLFRYDDSIHHLWYFKILQHELHLVTL